MKKFYVFALIVCSHFNVSSVQASPEHSAETAALPTGKLRHSYVAGKGPDSYFYWTAQPWTARDKPYIDIRRTVDNEVKVGKNLRSLVGIYKQRALAHPRDASEQFRWAYSAYLCYQGRWKTGKDESDVLRGVREALEIPKDTNSYQYARLRLLITHLDIRWFINPNVRMGAMRLIKRNPNDLEVKAAFAGELSFTSNTTKEQELGYKWAKEYLAMYPKRPQALYIMGLVLGNRVSVTRSFSSAQEAIGYLRQCQKIINPRHNYFKKAQDQIDLINRRVARYQKQGIVKR